MDLFLHTVLNIYWIGVRMHFESHKISRLWSKYTWAHHNIYSGESGTVTRSRQGRSSRKLSAIQITLNMLLGEDEFEKSRKQTALPCTILTYVCELVLGKKWYRCRIQRQLYKNISRDYGTHFQVHQQATWCGPEVSKRKINKSAGLWKHKWGLPINRMANQREGGCNGLHKGMPKNRKVGSISHQASMVGFRAWSLCPISPGKLRLTTY